MKKINRIIFIMVLLALIQLTRFLIKRSLFFVFPKTLLYDRISSAIAIVIITCLLIIVFKLKKIELNFFPKKIQKIYIVFSLFYIFLFVTSVILNQSNIGSQIFILVYSAILIPLFEEIIFRGYIWKELDNTFSNNCLVFAFSFLFFGLWHIGYIDSIASRVSLHVLMSVMFWKVVVGIIYGFILGIVRNKTKNCFSTILLHGVMNIMAP